MTLIEVLVAMAIVAVIALICTSAFTTVLGSEMRETNTRLASEQAEADIAAGAPPTTSSAMNLQLGEFVIPSTADSYEQTSGDGDTIAGEKGQIDISGDRSYTVVKGSDKYVPFAVYFGDYGQPPQDFVSKVKGIKFVTTGSTGDKKAFLVHVSGEYRIEAWGASGGAIGGSYAMEASVSIEQGVSLMLTAGAIGDSGGGTIGVDSVVATPGGIIVLAKGGGSTASSSVGITINSNDSNMPNPLNTNYDPKKPGVNTSFLSGGNPRGGFIRITYLGTE
jgi:prepilin-type N-terminal cleavage/methylation domain-containing protein